MSMKRAMLRTCGVSSWIMTGQCGRAVAASLPAGRRAVHVQQDIALPVLEKGRPSTRVLVGKGPASEEGEVPLRGAFPFHRLCLLVPRPTRELDRGAQGIEDPEPVELRGGVVGRHEDVLGAIGLPGCLTAQDTLI